MPRALWRKLRLPTLSAGAPCPVTAPHTVTTQLAPVLGSGPAFFTAGAYNPTDRSTMKTLPPDQGIAAGTGWSVGKAPLVVPKTLIVVFRVEIPAA